MYTIYKVHTCNLNLKSCCDENEGGTTQARASNSLVWRDSFVFETKTKPFVVPHCSTRQQATITSGKNLQTLRFLFYMYVYIYMYINDEH